jgi:hypothetical protein
VAAWLTTALCNHHMCRSVPPPPNPRLTHSCCHSPVHRFIIPQPVIDHFITDYERNSGYTGEGGRGGREGGR